jgi:hypothetical protein
VLARAGLGDDAGLAHALGQQGLPEHVADLVRARVVEVLALEPDLDPGLLGEPLGEVQRGRQVPVLAAELLELGGERRVRERGRVGGLELVERGDERLGDEAAPEFAPVAAGIWIRHGVSLPFATRCPGALARTGSPVCSSATARSGAAWPGGTRR